jgi:hypothetical protein
MGPLVEGKRGPGGVGAQDRYERQVQNPISARKIFNKWGREFFYLLKKSPRTHPPLGGWWGVLAPFFLREVLFSRLYQQKIYSGCFY